MASYSDVITRWHDRLMGHTTRQNLTNHRMPASDEALFSYGSHFPLVVATRDRTGTPTALIVNGDRYSPTTDKHQSHVRGMAQRSPLPHVIIPFSALGAAGVDPIDVEIIEATPDREERKTFVQHSLPSGQRFVWEKHTTWVPLDDAEIEWKLDMEWIKALTEWTDQVNFSWNQLLNREGGPRWKQDLNELSGDVPMPRTFLEACFIGAAVAFIDAFDMNRNKRWRPFAPEIPKRKTLERHMPNGRTKRDEDRAYYYHGNWDEKQVRTGFTLRLENSFGRSPWSWEMETFGYAPKPDSDFDGLYGLAAGVGVSLMCLLTGCPPITYTRETYRHWLGGALIKAKIRWVTYPACKTCDGTGYPGMTSDEGEALDWERRHNARCQDCLGGLRLGRRLHNNSRTAYFISDFDANETRPLYFFCEVPRQPKGSEPTTLAEAIELLKPEPVKLAEQMGREVYRQGDIFAIALDNVDRAKLRKAGATFERMGQLLNTNHVATDVARMPDGVTLVRGTLHHKPEWRDPDHRRVKLGNGKGWYAVVKNTVPVAA